MGVGATDAYFSDAYADLISRALRAKDLQNSVAIPDRLNNLKIPVTAVLRQAKGGWRWRMAARELIEDENVLSLEKIKQLFNHFFRKKHKLLTHDTVERWLLHRNSKTRLFGTTPAAYRKLSVANMGKAKEQAIERLEVRFNRIFQRRHDCIHNCDRPKIAVQSIAEAEVKKVVDDLEFLVFRCNEDFLKEFPVYLRGLGFNGATRARVCA